MRFRGALEGGFNHGFSLIDEKCGDHRIKVTGLDADEPTIETLKDALWKHSAEWGTMRVDVSGRITADRLLEVSRVHSFRFEEMTQDQKEKWWRGLRERREPSRE